MLAAMKNVQPELQFISLLDTTSSIRGLESSRNLSSLMKCELVTMLRLASLKDLV